MIGLLDASAILTRPELAPRAPVAPRAPGLSVRWVPLSAGIRGTRSTLGRMRVLTWNAVLNPNVRRASEWIAQNGGARGGRRLEEARALFDWQDYRLTYRRDPSGTDLLQDPVSVLLSRIEKFGGAAGDCDDHAMVAASLGHAIRLPIWWVLAGWEPGDYQHVYAAMALKPDPRTEADFLALDTGTDRAAVFGKHAEMPYRDATPALPPGVMQ